MNLNKLESRKNLEKITQSILKIFKSETNPEEFEKKVALNFLGTNDMEYWDFIVEVTKGFSRELA